MLASGSESLVLFVVAWAGSGAVAGLLTPLPYRHSPIRLGLGWLRETWPLSWRYALSFASMQGASLGVSVAIVGIAGSRALGAVRGALLLLGPFTQFQAASIAAGVAEVSRMRAGTDAVARHVRRTTTLTAGVAVANAVVLLLLPDALGRLVLGATWEHAERLLWPACVQMVMLGVISGVRSALLGLKVVRTTTRLDVVGTAITLGLTVVGAFVNGSLGAFWFLAAGQAVVAIMWWATYLSRTRRARRRDVEERPVLTFLRWLRHALRRAHDAVIGANLAQQRRLVKQGRMTIGQHTYGIPVIKSYDHDTTKLIVGSYSALSEEAIVMLGGEHAIDRVTTFPLRMRFKLTGAGQDGIPVPTGDTRIGSDVWLTMRTFVRSGVTIGDGAIIGSGAVVNKDVPPYAIVGGNPAKVIRYRFSEEQIAALLEIKWWDWSDELVLEAVPLLSGTDIDEFITWAREQRANGRC